MVATVAIGPATVEAGSADDENFDVGIELTVPLEINEQNPVDFGRIGRPSDTAVQVTLDWNNGTLSVEGEDVLAEDGENGRYQIWGPTGDEVEVTVTTGEFDDVEGVSIEEMHLNDDEDNTHNVEFTGQNSGGGNENNPQGQPLEIGGVVTVEPDAETGEHQTDLLLTATHE